MGSFITDSEQAIVDGLKAKIAILNKDVQAALVREVSWIERNIWPYTAAVLCIGLFQGWVF